MWLPCIIIKFDKFLHGRLIVATIVSMVTKIKMAGENEFNEIRPERLSFSNVI